MRILILGFPRSGTTILYKIFCEVLKDHVKLYEPFNDFVNLTDGFAIHDYMPIENNYHLLDPETRQTLVSNIWFEKFVQGKCKYGGDYEKVFTLLSKYENLLVKDIYIWPIVPEIRESLLKDWKIVVIYRDVKKIFEDLLKWYYQSQPWLNRRPIYLGKNGVMFYHPDIIWGLSLYYRQLFKKDPLKKMLPDKWLYGPGEILYLLVETYDKFIELMSPIADYEIIHDRLVQSPEYEIGKMFYELGIPVDTPVVKKVASLVKPL